MLSVCFASSCKWHSCLISHAVINWNRNLEGKRRGERTQKNILKKRQKLGLGRWLRWKVLGALPEDQGFWFPAPTAPTQGSSALPGASAPKDTKPSTGLYGYCTHMRSLHCQQTWLKIKEGWDSYSSLAAHQSETDAEKHCGRFNSLRNSQIHIFPDLSE